MRDLLEYAACVASVATIVLAYQFGQNLLGGIFG